MKSKANRILALVLAVSFVFTVSAVGTSSLADEAVTSPAIAADGSSYIEVNTVEEAVALIEANPEVFGTAAAEVEAPAADGTVISEPVKAVAATQAKAAQPKAGGTEKVPTIILPGISQSITYLADSNGDPVINEDGDELSGGLLIIDSSTLVKKLVPILAFPLIQSLIAQQDVGLSDAVYEAVNEVFWIQQSDLKGNPVNNLKTIEYNYPISQMTEDDRAYFYRMIPMQSVAEVIGEDNLYCFAFPLIGQPMQSAEHLDEYIQMVKEQTGSDKVNIITISLGGTILTAYLDLPGVDGSDLNHIINVVSLLDGTDLMGDFLARDFKIDDEFLYSEYIPSILEESNGYGTYGYLINIAIRILPKQVLYNVLTRAVDGILDSLVLNCPMFWAMVPSDRYEGLADRYLGDAQHATLRAITDRFNQAQLNLKDNLVDVKTNKSVNVSNICGYDLTYADYDYNFFGIMKSSDTTNSDGIIDIDSTSLGATYAKSNTILPIEYEGAAPGYLSPDGSIDASTCLFPDNVWFFYDQHHEVGRNDVVIKLASKLISGEIKSTADLPYAFPQFNGNRNTKNITRWYLSEAESVLNDPDRAAKYTPADIAELQEAYDDALALLADTICDQTKAEIVTERLLNALCSVGVRKPKEDQSTNKALEELTKFLSDVLYTVYGPQGFVDWQTNGVAITDYIK